MIHSRITSRGWTTIPKAVCEALGIGAGDTISCDIKDGVVRIMALTLDTDVEDYPFRLFTEWADEFDSVYDDL